MKDATKYAIHVANFQDIAIDDITFDTVSDGLHLGAAGKVAQIGRLRGKTGYDLFAVTQGDYAQYFDTGYIIGNFDEISCAEIDSDGAFDAAKFVPQSGYTWGVTNIGSVMGRFSGGAGLVQASFDSGVVKQDGSTPSTNGTINALRVGAIDNQQSSSKPLLSISCTLNTLELNNLSALLGNTAGTSNVVTVGATGTLNRLMGVNWDVVGGGGNATGVTVNGSGTLGDVELSNFKVSTMGAMLIANASSLMNGTLSFANGRGDTLSSFVTTAVRGVGSVPIPINCTGVSYTNYNGQFFTGASASAQIAAKLAGCVIPNGAMFSGTWLNYTAESTPEQRDTITFAATITPDYPKGSLKSCTFTGAMTIAAPTNVFTANGQEGLMLTVILIRNSVGAAAITWNAVYKFPVAFVDSAANTTRTVVVFRYDNNSNWVSVSGTNSWQ